MIEIAIDPLSVPAARSRIVIMRLNNVGIGTCRNVVVGLHVPPEVGLEQGRSAFDLPLLGPGEAYEHALRIRPVRTGRFPIGVPNLSYRNAYGESQRERDRFLHLTVEPNTESSTGQSLITRSLKGRTPVPHSIFISYRRSDTKMLVPALAKDLGRRKRLNSVDIFLDLADIKPGTLWSAALDQALGKCTLLIAVIGPKWLMASDSNGHRLDDTDDIVRHEIATALRRKIPVIPLIVDTSMPVATELPPDIRSLTQWQGFNFDLANYARCLDDLTSAVRCRLGLV